MSHVNNAARSSEGTWVFGLEEIPAADASEDGSMHQVAPAFGRTLIRAPEDTPQALRWAAEEFVDQCGPDWAVSSVLLQWLKIEAGDELLLGVESCVLERVSDDQIRLHANYNQWDDLVVPISVVRRMLVDMAHFIVTEARHPLPAWRIRRLGERDWSRRRDAE
ncbi:hypothetical protein [Streptomyces sp. NBC_01022]|uniref:hypothetical protein n=1 Tax=Streptomyces sp. NBC_01022 TaxID=2903723 RepID=UPI002DD97221|nr:hypothetical protein [Streptomyces sp. NBC_01022]WRZ82364.1 hypothetical protein OG316_19935 [Streptomyces sp. NBC_01022]